LIGTSPGMGLTRGMGMGLSGVVQLRYMAELLTLFAQLDNLDSWVVMLDVA
jgi:hypothetical protein